MNGFPQRVTVYEVGPRDGLQNEPRPIATADKIALVDLLSGTGLRHIEITSFVNPKWIPQLADGAEVSRRIARKPGLVYSALVPNKQGLDAAIAAGMKEVAVFMSASETHNKKNVNKTIAATLHAFRETIPPALNLSVAQSVPRISSVQVSNKTSNTLTLLVTGFATGLSLDRIELSRGFPQLRESCTCITSLTR
jgi:isopropylmalate/homocitrate/citramalate synthase